MTRKKLGAYHEERDVRRSGEPAGRRRRGRSKEPIFVVQKHDASTLHYDFRLEIDGVLASWAVPKGPSTDPREKRLAAPTDDHPLDYADFEGVIPEGEYGAGTVIVWDKGTFRNLDEDSTLTEGRRKGRLNVWLDGEKLRGGYALTRFREGRDEAWLLIKKRDEEADARRNPVRSEPKSAQSGRTLKQVEREEAKR
jgi:DNA ligase D-like protein (predicted 3'-phosphoesterase)